MAQQGHGRFQVRQEGESYVLQEYTSLDKALEVAKDNATYGGGVVYHVVDAYSGLVLVSYWYLIGQLYAQYPRTAVKVEVK